MAGRRALPDLVTRVLVDDTQLRKVGSTATGAGTAIKQGLDQSATPAVQRLQAAQQKLANASLSTTTVVNKGLQTSEHFTTSYGAALTKQEERYAKVQLQAMGLAKAERDLSSEGTAAARAFGTMGQQGAAVVDRFSALTGMMGSGGAMGLAVGAGVVGLGLLTAGAEQAVKGYFDLANEVRQYSSITGQSAEASSRQIGAFKELGVNEEAAQSSMLRLGRVVADTPAKLTALGVAIAHTNTGSVDLNGTLLNLIDRYNSTSDATQRSAIIYQAFGRAGQAMIPILQAGSAQLKELEARVKDTFTQADIDRARQEQLALGELADNMNTLKDHAGAAVAQGIAPLVNAMNKQLYIQQQMSENGGKWTLSANKQTGAIQDTASALGTQYDAQQKVKQATDALTQALADETKAQQDEEKAARDAYTGMVDADKAQLSYGKSTEQVAALADDYAKKQIALGRAQLDVTDKTQAVKDAVAKYGSKSEEAKKATYDLRDAQLALKDANRQLQGALQDQEDTVLTNALNYVQLQDALAKADGQTNTTADDQQNLVTGLENVRKELDPSNPLYKSLTAYIDTLENKIPKFIDTTFRLELQGQAPGAARAQAQAAAAAALDATTSTSSPARGARQFGGPVQPNRDYIVGEKGPELLRLGAQGGQVYPAGSPQTQSALHGGATINATFNAAGMSAWDVQRELAWMLKYGLR